MNWIVNDMKIKGQSLASKIRELIMFQKSVQGKNIQRWYLSYKYITFSQLPEIKAKQHTSNIDFLSLSLSNCFFKTPIMSLFAFFSGCFAPNSGSRISSSNESNSKVLSLKKPKSKPESPRGPIIVSYFPVGSNLSRL